MVVSDNPCVRTTGRGYRSRSRSCLVRYGDTALSDPPRLCLSTTLSKSAATTCLRKASSSAADARRILHGRGRVLRLIAGCATRRVETTCNRCAAREHARVASGCICQSYGMSSIGSSALFLPLRACLVIPISGACWCCRSANPARLIGFSTALAQFVNALIGSLTWKCCDDDVA